VSVSLPTAIKRTRQELAESEARTEALRIRLKALEEAANEFATEDGDQPPGNPGALPRTDAILAVMRTQPTTTWGAAELRTPVGAMRGTIEESKDLAAALSYLRSVQKIWSPRRGEWMLAGMPDPMAGAPNDPNEVPVGDVDPDDIPF
jgi:hypothetical protein